MEELYQEKMWVDEDCFGRHCLCEKPNAWYSRSCPMGYYCGNEACGKPILSEEDKELGKKLMEEKL